jgi:hypothetical protein
MAFCNIYHLDAASKKADDVLDEDPGLCFPAQIKNSNEPNECNDPQPPYLIPCKYYHSCSWRSEAIQPFQATRPGPDGAEPPPHNFMHSNTLFATHLAASARLAGCYISSLARDGSSSRSQPVMQVKAYPNEEAISPWAMHAIFARNGRYVTDSIHAKLPPANRKSGTRTFANPSPDPRPLAEASEGY